MNLVVLNTNDEMGNFIAVGMLVIFLISIFMIMRNFNMEKFTNKIKNKRIYIILFYTFMFILLVLLIFSIKNFINRYLENQEIMATTNEIEAKIKEENEFYKIQMNQKYSIEIPHPYIPTGFKYAEGDLNNGYVIEDFLGNQYVWVPCTNRINSEFIQLQKSSFGPNILFNYRECNDILYKDFIKSALANGGFYISRYEIGKENDEPVSKKNSEIWNNITRNEAIEIVKRMYNESEEYNCEIINGYGWDTTYIWITRDNDVEKYYYNYAEGEKILSGRKAYNNVYDFTDNILEITLENYYNKPILRGFLEIKNEDFQDETRNTVYDDDSTRIYDSELTAIRTVIYKK